MIIDFAKIQKLSPKNSFEKQVLDFIEEWTNSAPTVSVQTSGSTGNPKVFDIEKERMLHSAKTTLDFLHIKEGETALLCLPIAYISGKMMVVRSISRNLKLHVVEPTSKPLEELNAEIEFCAMTPLQVENSIGKLHYLKKIIIGGAAVSENLKSKITESLNDNKNSKSNEVYETYGMSETLSHIALKQIYPNREEYFAPVDGVEVSLDDRGCLQIYSPKLNNQKLITNDLVELVSDEHKTKFKFLGRWDNVINSGGLKVHPEQLEKIVKTIIPYEAVFVGLPDERLGEKLVLVIEGAQNQSVMDDLSSISYPSKNHQPKEIVFISAIPRLPNGKISRKDLVHLLTVGSSND